MAPERRSLDTRNKILEVAERQFAREGFAGAHLQDIASQVGVQKTALYYYFPSKAALYQAVLFQMLDDFDRVVTEAVERSGSPGERLEVLLDRMNALLSERPNYSQLLIRTFVDQVRVVDPSQLRPRIERVVGLMLAFYREGVDSGDFVRLSSRHMFQTLLGATVFHYATGDFGASVLGEEDLFTRNAVAWRREEVRKLFQRGILRELPDDDD